MCSHTTYWQLTVHQFIRLTWIASWMVQSGRSSESFLMTRSGAVSFVSTKKTRTILFGICWMRFWKHLILRSLFILGNWIGSATQLELWGGCRNLHGKEKRNLIRLKENCWQILKLMQLKCLSSHLVASRCIGSWIPDMLFQLMFQM